MVFSKLKELLSRHTSWRGECLNLIASENVTSPAVRVALSSDLGHRYAEGFLRGERFERFYQGAKYFDEIEIIALELAKELFDAEHANVVPISGVIANMVAFKALASAGDKLISLSVECGGHISHTEISAAGVLGLKSLYYAFDEEEMSIDVDASRRIIEKEKPKLLVFGGSLFLFPHPVRELKEAAEEVGANIIYDASHVAGLIAGGLFQQPFEEGADVVTASTHKTLPGPQGGMVLCKLGFAERVDRVAFPGLVSNHHLHHVAGLAIALAELKAFGKDYARTIVENAKALGQALCERGFEVLAEARDFTETHQLALDAVMLGGGRKVAELCEEANIILNKNLLPWDKLEDAPNPSGVRIGVQEVTRLGMGKGEMVEVAELMERLLLKGESPTKVREDVKELVAGYRQVKFCFEEGEAYKLLGS